MGNLRRLFIEKPRLAWCLIGLALLVRIAVPAGFMPVPIDGGPIRLALCPGSGTATRSMPAMHHEGMTHRDNAPADGHPGDAPCAFAALGLPSLAGADPVLLDLAIAFILAIGLRIVVTPVSWRVAGPRPPSRGPPRSGRSLL